MLRIGVLYVRRTAAAGRLCFSPRAGRRSRQAVPLRENSLSPPAGGKQTKSFSRRALAPEFCKARHMKREGREGKGNRGVAPRCRSSLRPFRQSQTNKKEAERRQTLFNNLRTSGCGSAPSLTLPRKRGRVREGAARLSAFHHGSHQRESSSLRLSFRPGFLGRGLSARS
jgi:hypothetical protein